ncbi:MmyB family transcriptional regulator [Nocardioides nematodiphilus]|uniref:MmyB family transcriptional regulator n=1 Tax=Nocardioides nematodiphilus TaxID=2849669 RepID=UPI001CD94050|nr:hypothetical protein [Nocardioides nematodiphilus]MCA1981283.1 hypothetical protein [Nocardioides nematodiphilus]
MSSISGGVSAYGPAAETEARSDAGQGDGLFPDDRKLSLLVGELAQRSSWFATLGTEHPVFDCGYGLKSFAHPVVRRLDLSYEALLIADSSQRMVLYTAAPGSATADGLALLARG